MTLLQNILMYDQQHYILKGSPLNISATSEGSKTCVGTLYKAQEGLIAPKMAQIDRMAKETLLGLFNCSY